MLHIDLWFTSSNYNLLKKECLTLNTESQHDAVINDISVFETRKL